MKTIKYTLILLFTIITAIHFQSCKYNIFGAPTFVKQNGYITDTLGNGISKVRLDILKAEEFFTDLEETDYVFYTDENGHYEIDIDNNDYIYYIKMTHPDYIYTTGPNGYPYPQTARGESDEDRNYQMVKKGPVKIEGNAICRDGGPFWLDSVKVSVLKRPVGSTAYPNTTGIYTFTDENGKFYIEYPEDKDSEFFLKPEKEGYYFDKGSIIDSLGTSKNYDPGYIIGASFDMELK